MEKKNKPVDFETLSDEQVEAVSGGIDAENRTEEPKEEEKKQKITPHNLNIIEYQ